MNVKAVRLVGEAEDMYIIADSKSFILLKERIIKEKVVCPESVHIPLTRQQARKLALELLAHANRCDELEQGVM